ncbi:MAG: hypothetical protein RR315_08815, partial [Oscillospiraceae bacterium]
MGKRKSIFLTAGALVLAVLLCLLLYRYDNKYSNKSPQPINGMLFLSKEDLANDPVCFLIREWEFFPNALLTPEEAASYQGYRRYADIGGVGSMMEHSSGTYRLTLMLPPKMDTYALEVPEIFSACRLFINGSPVLQLGDPSPQSYTEGIARRMILFSAEGRTELVLNVSDFSGVYSGMTSPPTFGIAQAVFHQREIHMLLHGAAVLLSLIGMALALAFGI